MPAFRGQGKRTVGRKPVSYTHLDVYKRQEEVRFEENRPCIDTRFSEHGEETVVFLLVETDGVPVHRWIKFGISP